MATNYFSNITQRGVNAKFHEAMSATPTVWDKHCQTVPSNKDSELYAWLGMMPVPQEHVGERDFQGIRDFSFTVKNKAYELSAIINRDSVADDQTGTVSQRIGEIADVWATFKDYLFATALLEAGLTSTATFDGTAFFAGTRVIGGSANIDNTATSDAATDFVPTVAEFQTGLNTCLTAMWKFQDDQGRPFNSKAMSQLRVVIPPDYYRTVIEAVNSERIGGSDNPWGKGIVEVDVLPYLTLATTFYLSAVGATRKPFMYQQREPLEIVVYNSTNDVADNNGLKILCRERFRFAFGDPRRCHHYVYT